MNEKILVSHPYHWGIATTFYFAKALEAGIWVLLGIDLERGIENFTNCVYMALAEILCLFCLFKLFKYHSIRLALESTGIRITDDKYGEVFFKWQDLPNAYETHTQKNSPYIVISNAVYGKKELIKLCSKACSKRQFVYYDNDAITVVFDPQEFPQTPDEVRNFISQHSHLR